MLEITMKTQPDDVTCGPTSLHAIYRYYGDDIRLQQVIQEMEFVKTGGTVGAFLGKHALKRGYKANLYVYNLSLFDPSWFVHHAAEPDYLISKLLEQEKYKTDPRFLESSRAIREFLSCGGQVYFKDLTAKLLKHYFEKRVPIITGLSATYLYECARERMDGERSIYDDIKGEPCGHFVILCGYDEQKRHVVVADPHRANPISKDNYYKVSINRLINAILLGVLTYDANLLTIEPK